RETTATDQYRPYRVYEQEKLRAKFAFPRRVRHQGRMVKVSTVKRPPDLRVFGPLDGSAGVRGPSFRGVADGLLPIPGRPEIGLGLLGSHIDHLAARASPTRVGRAAGAPGLLRLRAGGRSGQVVEATVYLTQKRLQTLLLFFLQTLTEGCHHALD